LAAVDGDVWGVSEMYGGYSKAEARKYLVARWQQEWEVDHQGRWTHKLIADLDQWLTEYFNHLV